MSNKEDLNNILITGGFGFIGTNLIDDLLRQNCNVYVVDSLHPQIHKDSFHVFMDHSKVKFIVGDIRNSFIYKNFLKECDTIVHLAAETGTNQSEDEIYRYTDNNICGTSILMDLLNHEKHNVKKFILASSRAVYGEGPNKKESDILNPLSVYGITKKVQELLVINSCPVDYTILRFQNVYGPGQSLTNPYTGILSIFLKRLLDNKDIEIFDNNKATRDFVYVSDVVDSIALVLKTHNKNEIYNVGTGEQTTIYEIASTLKSILKSKCSINITDFHRKGDVINVSADISKITEQLNWKPKINLLEGINKLIRWGKNK